MRKGPTTVAAGVGEVPLQTPAGAGPQSIGGLKEWIFNLVSPISSKQLKVGAAIAAVLLVNHLSKRRR